VGLGGHLRGAAVAYVEKPATSMVPAAKVSRINAHRNTCPLPKTKSPDGAFVFVAEAVRFELTDGLHHRRFSRPVP
jgi:hypothetical protein